MAVKTKGVTVKELIETARKEGIRRILLTDYATTEPKREGGVIVLVGMITLVATALDVKNEVIYRWFEQGESERMVTIIAGAGRGPNPGGRLATKKAQLQQILREEGFEVDEGEWTPQAAEAYVASRRKIVG